MGQARALALVSRCMPWLRLAKVSHCRAIFLARVRMAHQIAIAIVVLQYVYMRPVLQFWTRLPTETRFFFTAKRRAQLTVMSRLPQSAPAFKVVPRY